MEVSATALHLDVLQALQLNKSESEPLFLLYFQLGGLISLSPQAPGLDTLESCPLHLLNPLPCKAPNPPFHTGCIALS